jgi:hypothetical protein
LCNDDLLNLPLNGVIVHGHMFDTLSPTTNHPLLQDTAFVEALRLCGSTPLTLPNGMTLLKQRFFGLPLLMLPRAAPPADLAHQLRETGVSRIPLLLSPEVPCALPRALRLQGPKQIIWLNLFSDATRQRSTLHGKWRNQLRKAEASNIRVDKNRLPPDPDDPVLQLETAQSRTRGYRNWPPALTAAFAAAAPEQTHLFRAYRCKQVIAHMLFLSHGNTVTYHIGHTTDVGRTCHAHNLIVWQAMRHFADQGYQRMNLGPANPRNPGLDRFKLRMGAQALPTGGTWLYWRPL